MSLFDFPRIHFSGNIDVNVPTINNTVYYPLTIYDATRSEAFIPPRLYFSSADIIKKVNSKLNPKIYSDPANRFNYVYIEIEPINTIELLRTWCMTPVPSSTSDPNPDAAYVPFYVAANNDLGQQEGMGIMGKTPGYWNMFGDMTVKMSSVVVTGVQLFDGSKVQTWTKNSNNIPANVAPFLNASFDLDTQPATGITTASMVETISNQSVYANIFCSNVNLYSTNSTNNIFLQGKPFRFSALIYSAWKVVNWMPPMAGSGRFCSCIPMEEISNAEKSALVKFFNANKSYDNRPLKGVFVTFVIEEVYENRYDQNIYKENGAISNPAQSTTVGSITPWYEGDMRTGLLGRNLISMGMNPIYINVNSVPGAKIPIMMAPPIASLKNLGNGKTIFSVDMGNSWPEAMSPTYSPPPPTTKGPVTIFQPTHRGQASFDTANLGMLSLRYASNPSTEIARISINATDNPLSKVFQTGCVFDFVLTDPALIKNIQSNLILGYLISPGNSEKQVLKESEYMISSDQKGLYADQGDLPSKGYQVYDHRREPCRIRIYQKGVPVTAPIQVGVAEYIVPESANDPQDGPDSFNWQPIADNGIVALSDENLQIQNNAIYYFVYNNQYPNNKVPYYAVNNNYTIMDTGSFVCMRVHRTKDYSKYIDPSNPDYTPPTFEVIYEEVFKMYDVAYPAMALVHPFTKEIWNNGTMAGLVVQRTHPEIWNNILYMPKSRELSACQLALLKAWADYLNKS
jgi:hypothetical protein